MEDIIVKLYLEFIVMDPLLNIILMEYVYMIDTIALVFLYMENLTYIVQVTVLTIFILTLF